MHTDTAKSSSKWTRSLAPVTWLHACQWVYACTCTDNNTHNETHVFIHTSHLTVFSWPLSVKYQRFLHQHNRFLSFHNAWIYEFISPIQSWRSYSFNKISLSSCILNECSNVKSKQILSCIIFELFFSLLHIRCKDSDINQYVIMMAYKGIKLEEHT